MEKGKIVDKKPIMVELQKGKTYAWCSCGQSANQPWCDGSHKGTNFTPVVFEAQDNKTAALCLCKQTNNPPFCDGTHSKL